MVTSDPINLIAPTPRASLPRELALSTFATQRFSAYLRAAGLRHYDIYQPILPTLSDLDEVLTTLAPDAVWACEKSPAHVQGVPVIQYQEAADAAPRLQEPGYLRLRKLEVVVARWQWTDPQSTYPRMLQLIAAPRRECIAALRDAIVSIVRQKNVTRWQIVGDYGAIEHAPRHSVRGESLVIEPSIHRRVETELIRFFSPSVRQMYARLGVCYRRGVLLHGEPGNGKTSLIRMIATQLPQVSALMVRPGESFDTDSLVLSFNHWRDQAPALLVIEDIDAVLERVNLSTVLNVLDGIDRRVDGGLLVATTNHPDKLDAALSNRPGRFDVVIEVPSPAAAARELFLRSRLLEIDCRTIARLVELTERFSFAHLEEVVRLAGLLAVREERLFRSGADVLEAAGIVRESFDAAQNGYVRKPEMPFGLKGFVRTSAATDQD
jgi:hypothetical protein